MLAALAQNRISALPLATPLWLPRKQSTKWQACLLYRFAAFSWKDVSRKCKHPHLKHLEFVRFGRFLAPLGLCTFHNQPGHGAAYVPCSGN